MTQTQEQVIVDIWDAIDTRIDARVEAKLRTALANHRPRGNGPLWLGAGAVGATITPSTTNPQMHGLLSTPCSFDEIQLVGYPAGIATLDVWIQRPDQDAAMAASIFNSIYPVLDDGAGGTARSKQILVDPANSWTTYIEPGSIAYFYVRALTGCETISLTFTLRYL